MKPSGPLALTSPRDRHHFRPDLQGLRALAVLAVVADHAAGWPSGGFLGVDVFFVLSGFLITGILLRELEKAGRISFRSFYVRRVKRILPLASLVIGVTVLAGWATFNGSRAVASSVDALWATFFAANVRFEAIGTDYFQNQGPVSPLQHYWSLSVEEQFYFVWPAVMVLVVVLFRTASRRATHRALTSVMLVVVVGSYLFSLWEGPANPTGAYFSTISRSWELGAGALLALMASRVSSKPRALGVLLGWGGLAGILCSFLLLDSSLPFPAPWALIPVLSTVAVIASGIGGEPGWCLPLTNPVSRYLGDVSFGLYLWHFPVIVILEAAVPWSEPARIAFGIGLSIALAAASHHLVEKPIISSPLLVAGLDHHARVRLWHRWWTETARTLRVAGLSSLAGCTALVVGLALAPSPSATPAFALAPLGSATASAGSDTDATDPSSTVATAGPQTTTLQSEIRTALESTAWPDLEPTIDAVLDGSREGSENLACGSSDTDGRTEAQCSWGPSDATKTAVLVGDSTAMHYLDALVGVVEAPGSSWRLVNRAMFACPFLDAAVDTDVPDAAQKCGQHNQASLARIDELKPDLVIVTNSYQAFKDQATGSVMTAETWSTGSGRFLDRVKTSGSSIAFLASPPDDADIAACYTKASGPSRCVSKTQKLWLERAATDRKTAERLDATFVDTRPLMCLQDLCPAFVGAVPVKEDRVHLTTAFQKKMSPALGEVLRSEGVL